MKIPGPQRYLSVVFLAGALVALGGLMSCGGGSTTLLTQPSGSLTTSLSDPAICKAPMGDFNNAWVTITKVTANVSSSAAPSDSGWITLVDLTSAPKQIDLLSLQSKTCLLTQLGSTSGLAPGNYQQIRLYLLSNSPASGTATPSTNNCGSSAFNCVVLSDGSVHTLLLSSEAQTGIKIPSGQIAGGQFTITAGQSADLNIDFDTCDSLVVQGNGDYRLKPVLTAGEVSLNQNSISGVAVDSITHNPIPNAIVMAEQPDSNSVDRVIEATVTGSDGSFIFCPLPSGNYDMVVAAFIPGTTPVTYNATITFKVPLGTNVGNIPLVAETVLSQPATITGQVTTQNASAAGTSADIGLSALQDATPTGGTLTHVTVPAYPPNSTPTLTTANTGCTPTTIDCGTYTLVVPASNPQVGTFASAGTTYTAPASGAISYTVNAQASTTTSTGSAPDCSPSSVTTSSFAVTAGMSTTAPTIGFTGCS